MVFADVIADRAVGQYPISVATSLALESAFGIHPEIVVDQAPILQYPQMWINVRTLYRNLVGAVPTTEQGLLFPPRLALAIAEEMDAITSLITTETEGRTEVFFYLSNYAQMERKYKHAVLRKDSTTKQKDATLQQNATLELLLKERSDDIQGWDLKLKPVDTKRSFLITHYAYDLLSADRWPQLALLETHTGAIKERSQWYTKYYNGKDLPAGMPFTEYFLQVFGDNQHFRPLDHKLREAIVELAVKYKWGPATTMEKIMYGIEQLPNPWMKELVRDLIHESRKG